MAYVRSKNINGVTRHYLVETKRDGSRVRQKTLIYLGEYDNPAAALEGWTKEAERVKGWITKYQQDVDKSLSRINPNWIERNGGVIPTGRHRGVRLSNNPCRQYWIYVGRLETSQQRLAQLEERIEKIKQYL